MTKPVRRNVAHISKAERDRLRDAFLNVNRKLFPDGVSYWYKQDQIHQNTHVHGLPSFLPWHRELLNRFEALLQEVDPLVALHYWDWTTDPRNSSDGNGGIFDLFNSDFLGASSGPAGPPFAGKLDNNGILAGSRGDDTGNPADPPRQITRHMTLGAPTVDSDLEIVTFSNSDPVQDQWKTFRQKLERSPNHNDIHGWVGGTMGPPVTAFEEPFVFLVHANIDRLWAMWQSAPGFEWRLDPSKVYGTEGTHSEITKNFEPWAGGVGLRPWAPPDNQQEQKNAKHPSVVAPPPYDTVNLFQKPQSRHRPAAGLA